MTLTTKLRPDDALVLIDVQNDFLPGGARAVPRADEIIPVLNAYLARFARRRLPVFATRDWHPLNHCSFHAQSGEWPPHAVAQTRGAEFPPSLNLPPRAITIAKGCDPDREALSAFAGTRLEQDLRLAGARRLFVGGLATEYAVLHTVREALHRGFRVCLLTDAIRAMNLSDRDGSVAEAEMVRLGAQPITFEALTRSNPGASALLTDQYQLTMLGGYFAAEMEETAVFEFFVRRLPADWNFLVAAGLEQALEYLEHFRLTPAELDWLQTRGGCRPDRVRRLRELRFTGDVHAMPEGTIFFPDEPILRVTAPIAEAQIVETRLVNLLHFQTLIASKAVRSVLAAPGKALVDFGARRAHGAEASLLAARACYLAGFDGTSNVLAGAEFEVPLAGTMAHSFIEACETEEEAFLRFARANPDHVVLLLDTYDTEAAARKVVALAPALHAEGIRIQGVRLDSGDLDEQARAVRAILDDGGLRTATIFASGNLDEHELHRLVAGGAPIDGFGIGSRVVTSADAPYLDCAYKLQSYAGTPRCKLSEAKATWPGAKQVYRHFDHDGPMAFDVIATAEETRLGLPLLECVMHQGQRTGDDPALADSARRLRRQLALLPPVLRGRERAVAYPVVKSQALQTLARRLGLVPSAARTGARLGPVGRRHAGFEGRIHADATPASGEEHDVEDNVMI